MNFTHQRTDMLFFCHELDFAFVIGRYLYVRVGKRGWGMSLTLICQRDYSFTYWRKRGKNITSKLLKEDTKRNILAVRTWPDAWISIQRRPDFTFLHVLVFCMGREAGSDRPGQNIGTATQKKWKELAKISISDELLLSNEFGYFVNMKSKIWRGVCNTEYSRECRDSLCIR